VGCGEGEAGERGGGEGEARRGDRGSSSRRPVQDLAAIAFQLAMGGELDPSESAEVGAVGDERSPCAPGSPFDLGDLPVMHGIWDIAREPAFLEEEDGAIPGRELGPAALEEELGFAGGAHRVEAAVGGGARRPGESQAGPARLGGGGAILEQVRMLAAAVGAGVAGAGERVEVGVVGAPREGGDVAGEGTDQLRELTSGGAALEPMPVLVACEEIVLGLGREDGDLLEVGGGPGGQRA
jgi:hypothetical protein